MRLQWEHAKGFDPAYRGQNFNALKPLSYQNLYFECSEPCSRAITLPETATTKIITLLVGDTRTYYVTVTCHCYWDGDPRRRLREKLQQEMYLLGEVLLVCFVAQRGLKRCNHWWCRLRNCCAPGICLLAL